MFGNVVITELWQDNNALQVHSMHRCWLLSVAGHFARPPLQCRLSCSFAIGAQQRLTWAVTMSFCAICGWRSFDSFKGFITECAFFRNQRGSCIFDVRGRVWKLRGHIGPRLVQNVRACRGSACQIVRPRDPSNRVGQLGRRLKSCSTQVDGL